MSCGEFTPDLLAHRWKWHLRRKFREEGVPGVVQAFGCSYRAAEYWWAGEQIPRCFVMMRYLNDNPDARAEIYGERA